MRLTYTARNAADRLGFALAAGAVALGGLLALARRRRSGGLDPERPAPAVGPESPTPAAGPSGRWLTALPVLLLALLASLRLLPARPHAGETDSLYEKASRAYSEERWDAAAEYARHGAVLASPADPRRGELLCVRGEALLRAGHAREAEEAFASVVEIGTGPHRPQALFSGAVARAASGNETGAREWRQRLREEYPETPWARRLEAAR